MARKRSLPDLWRQACRLQTLQNCSRHGCHHRILPQRQDVPLFARRAGPLNFLGPAERRIHSGEHTPLTARLPAVADFYSYHSAGRRM